MKLTWAILTLCTVLGHILEGQEVRSSQTDLVIKTYTKLVQVPVVVTDKSGQAVHGLTKDDFEIYEDGKKVVISTFQVPSENMRFLPARKLIAPGFYTNVAAAAVPEQPIIILVIDAINTPFLDQLQGRRQLIKLLSQSIEPGTMMSLMVISKSELRILHDYTTETTELIRELNRATVGSSSNGGVPTSESTSTQVSVGSIGGSNKSLIEDFLTGGKEFESLRRTAYSEVVLLSLRQIAQRFAGVPGRKSLIWMASNFPYFGDDTSSIHSGDIRGKYIQTFEQLNDANVAVYPVDTAGLAGYKVSGFESAKNPGGNRQSVGSGGGFIGGFGDTALGRINEKSDPRDNMKVLAELTGGTPYYGSNDLSGAMRNAVADANNYYMLGYYLGGGANAKLGRRQLRVAAVRKDLKLRSRTRLFITRESFSPRDEISAALKSPMESVNLPMTVSWDPKAIGTVSPFVIAVDGRNIELTGQEAALNLTIVVEARTPQGKTLDYSDKTLTGNIKLPADFRSRPFEYKGNLAELSRPATVRFVVRDNNSGKIGSVIVDVKEN